MANYTAARVAHVRVDRELEIMAEDILANEGRAVAVGPRFGGDRSLARVMGKLRDWDVSRTALLEAWSLLSVAQQGSCQPLPPDLYQAILFGADEGAIMEQDLRAELDKLKAQILSLQQGENSRFPDLYRIMDKLEERLRKGEARLSKAGI